MDNQRIIRLHKDDDMSWALLPICLKRVNAFCKEYHSDAKPDELCRIIQLNFVSDNPQIIVVAAYEKGVGVFGHLVACVDEFTGVKFLTILQFELDRPVADRERLKEAWEAVKMWGRSQGAVGTQILTSTPARERLFRRWGFERCRILMRQPL